MRDTGEAGREEEKKLSRGVLVWVDSDGVGFGRSSAGRTGVLEWMTDGKGNLREGKGRSIKPKTGLHLACTCTGLVQSKSMY